jgi:energy-coupling factor transporter ATP-binding protein EcfA2
MAFAFKPATKAQAKLRLGLCGPAGSGKTKTMLRVLRGLVGPTGRIAVIDSERGSASLYAEPANPFDVCELTSFSPENYVQAIHAAEAAGYDALGIDSLSHAWSGKDGALEKVDAAAKRSKSGNSYMAWREVTPLHNAMVDAILQCRCHVVATLRTKVEYVIETNSKGQQVPRKVGLQPIQRDGLDYEMTIVGDITLDHDLLITKTRAPFLTDAVIRLPGEELGQQLAAWLADGTVPELPPAPEPKPAVAPEAAKPAAHANANGGFISEGQRRNLEGVAKANGHTHDGLKAWLAVNHGIESTTEIPATLFVTVARRLSDKTPLTEAA